MIKCDIVVVEALLREDTPLKVIPGQNKEMNSSMKLFIRPYLQQICLKKCSQRDIPPCPYDYIDNKLVCCKRETISFDLCQFLQKQIKKC